VATRGEGANQRTAHCVSGCQKYDTCRRQDGRAPRPNLADHDSDGTDMTSKREISGDLGRLANPSRHGPHRQDSSNPNAGQHTQGDFHDWQSHVRLRSVDRFRNRLFRSARGCGPVRRNLAHGRGDDQRPLRKDRDWSRDKRRPNLFDEWKIRFSPHSVGRTCFSVRAGAD